jgi:hypothetical protein
LKPEVISFSYFAEIKMEISSETLESLQYAGDSAHIPDKCFHDLVRKVCECALNNCSRNAISGKTFLCSPLLSGPDPPL